VTSGPWLFTGRYPEPAVAAFDGAKIRVTVGFPKFRLRYMLDATSASSLHMGLCSCMAPNSSSTTAGSWTNWVSLACLVPIALAYPDQASNGADFFA
jgi:hypothetical protein